MQNKKKLAYITPALPDSGDSGGLIVTLERLELLARKFDVTVLSISAADTAIRRHMAAFNLSAVHHAGRLRPRTGAGYLRSLLEGLPLAIWRNVDPAFLTLAQKVGEQRFDLTYVDHWLMWPAQRQLRHAGHRVLNLHNAEHLLFDRAAERAGFPMKQVLNLEASRSASYLRAICQEADEVHFISSTDRDEVMRLGGIQTPTQVFLPWVPIDEGPFGEFGGNALFVGTMSWAPNAEGARWYQDRVVPLLPADRHTDIVGGYIDGTRPSVTQARVTWHGRVPDLTPLYRRAGVFVAPLLSGSGIKMKILNALGRGLPVVTTTRGAEGFPPGGEDAVAIADQPHDFAAAIQRLTTDRASWQRASDAARPYLLRNFSSQKFLRWTEQIAR